MLHSFTCPSNELKCSFELGASWQEVLREELLQPYLLELANFLARERAGPIPIYPPENLVFNAFHKTPYDRVKVVIIGQDPYHGPGQAHGLSFSVPEGVKSPPSLKNIFKELHTDLGKQIPAHGCLTHWAEQGVMLLNATLTVRQGEPLSHHGKGWERFTDAVVRSLIDRPKPVIFVLWGKFAQGKYQFLRDSINGHHHAILVAAHPSPFSAHHGFFGSQPFSKINALLIKNGDLSINW